jgi:serine/threonine protein kinase
LDREGGILMAKKAPAKIGRYKVLGELGRGAMGVVYKASDPSLERTVALKTILLSDDMEGRDDYRKRFLLEAKAAGQLTHPSIVTTYEFGEEGDVAYMAMELLEGTDLRQCLKEGTLQTVEAVEVAAQVADGLGFAHERGVVHRDIKPGNIMLLERGQAKIMDFGIARTRSADHKTSTGIVLGTPRFMSPEQIAGQPVDSRSDIFSLGAVLYELLTRTPLFAGEDPAQIAHNVASLEHVAPSRANPEVTSMLDFVVARALKKDPAQRYQDAYEMASDLRACLGEVRERHAAAVKNAGDGEGTRTLRLEPGAPPPVAPGAVAPDTRLPVSPRIDSAAALKRLGAPSRADRRAFARAPRAPGVMARLARDEGPKRLLGSAAVAALAAALVTYYF